MHDTASISGDAFAKVYGGINKIVVDIGGKNVNGSLRSFFENKGMRYICVDMEEDASVDIVVKPGEKLPFESNSIDLVVSTSCFEHDPCFWMTFKDISRILKLGGYLYVNAPSDGVYHKYPGDNWRFYSDAGQALAYWSSYQIGNDETYHMKVIETFHILPNRDIWTDFVCVWQRVNEKQTEIIVSDNISHNVGILQNEIHKCGLNTKNKF